MTVFSTRESRLNASPIRDILKAIDVPGMVSFAGGLPSPDSFPNLDSMEFNRSKLQYGHSEGEEDLRCYLADQMNQRGINVDPQHVLILSGSQQGIDLVAKLFIDPGTTIGIEKPTYLAALQVFDFFGANYQTFSIDESSNLTAVDNASTAFVYTVPTFQNPTGHVYTATQRRHLAEYCDRSDTVLFEDDPYRDLVYDECERTPICSMVKSASWIYQSSLSKTLAPGFRLGYLACSPDLFPSLSRLKQAADLHTNRLTQHLALTLLQHPDRTATFSSTLERYRVKRDLFDTVLKRHFNDIASWQLPAGGLFFWLSLRPPYRQDTRDLLPIALENNIAFMPGETFFPSATSEGISEGLGTLRLNFSHASDAAIEPALVKLAALIRDGAAVAHQKGIFAT